MPKCKLEIERLAKDCEDDADENVITITQKQESKRNKRAYKNIKDAYVKVTQDFEVIGKEVSEKEKLYIENSRKSAKPKPGKHKAHDAAQ